MTSTAVGQRVDIGKLRVARCRMSRRNLLSVAYRAIELVTRARLGALVAGMVQLDLLTEGRRDAPSLLEQVRTFHDACLRGDYYDTAKGPLSPVREAFALLRRLDRDP